ncbi:glycine betaine ABC transporter substrate-binding protein [Methylibium sp.]|uniref:ABC transporter permease/substrate-binding protein n=1 Tax=Methylibium sp. TaxID=2067992 RepID=UPI001792C356|nr:glycine betaine ABC transporter substrate-binding protein [Methylibium sp.]MBA3590557.1 ABC transporter permease subunit [Methylibium sp.]
MRGPFAFPRLVTALLLVLAAAVGASAATVQVGSKRFTESYLLGAIVTETLARAGVPAEHRPGLGNTAVLEQALSSGSIDVYPEYTGTIVRELLKREGDPSLDQLNDWLAPRGLKAAVPLGFSNSYALALREADAARLGLETISDLKRPAAKGLRLGLSHEFLGRTDGWPALRRAYGLPFASPAGLDHGLAYTALAEGQVDVIDIYSTDARLVGGALRVLRDDRRFFPSYEAVLLMRAGLDAAALQTLTGRIDAPRMIALNAAVELDRRPYAEVAREFVAGLPAPGEAAPPKPGEADAPPPVADAAQRTPSRQSTGARFWQRLWAPDFWRLTGQHLTLVFGSLALAAAIGVPLGVLAWRRPALAQTVLGVVGVIQTIPSLAMLAFLIVLVGGIGFVPALLALFLYALLPIVRNTHAGLLGVGAGLSSAAKALGLTRRQRLRHVELPRAMPTLLAGVQTAATINVGTATMAAFIGAGGYGERIVAGLALNDTAVLLSGAVPAAVLAVLMQGAFEAALRLRHRR